MVGTSGTPGHIEWATSATLSMMSGVGGDSGLTMGGASKTTEMPGS